MQKNNAESKMRYEQVKWLGLLTIVVAANAGIECYHPPVDTAPPQDVSFMHVPHHHSEPKLLANTAGLFVGLLWGTACSFWYGEAALFKWWTIVYFVRCFSILTPQAPFRGSQYDFPDMVLKEWCPDFPAISMFSGHVGFVVTLIRYARVHKWHVLYWLLHVFNGFQIMVQLESRGHYSNELVVGYVVGMYAM